MRVVRESAALLLLLLHAAPAAAKKGSTSGDNADYRKTLLRELGIPGVNLTYGEGGLLQATQAFKPGELVLVIPPKYVLTVQEALGSGAGSLINRNSRQLRRTLPRHFVMAMWVLYTKHVQKRKTDLWYLWLASLPRFDTCPVFWGETELRMLEEERALKRSRARQRSLADEYESMVRVLLDAGMEEDAGEGAITLEEYYWAVTVVSACSFYFAEDFPVLVPLRLRAHPHGAAEVFEWGNETNPGAALYVGEEGLSEGGELTVYSDQFNGQLLLHSGHVWDETRASAPEVRLSAGELSSREVGSRDAGAEARRTELMAARNLSHVMDFSLQSDELPAGLLPWLRLALATSAQVEAASGAEDFDAPLSTASERLAVETLHVTLDRTLAEYDFDVDEDEQLLEAVRRGRVVRPAREVTAVTYRLGCKRVLLATRRLAAAHLARWTQQQRQQTQQYQAQQRQAQQQQQQRWQPQARSSPPSAAVAKGAAAVAAAESTAPSAESLLEELPEVVPAPMEEETVAVGVAASGAQEEVVPREEPQPRDGKKKRKKSKSASGGSL